MSILISGSDGFLGQSLTSYLAAKGIEFTMISRSNAVSTENEIIHVDLSISKEVRSLDLSKYSCYINLAGHTAGNPFDVVDFVDSNFVTLHNLLSNRTFVPKKIIHVSSQVIYQNVPSRLYAEDDPLDGNDSSYAYSKIIAEQYLGRYSTENQCAVFSLRLPGFFDGGGFVTYAINNAKQSEDVIIWGDGSNKRQYMSRTSFCKAVELTLKNNSITKFEAFNLGSEDTQTVLQTTKCILKNLNSASRIIKNTTHSSLANDIDLDLKKAQSVLGFKPENYEFALRKACKNA